jgi:hypothetical protein
MVELGHAYGYLMREVSGHAPRPREALKQLINGLVHEINIRLSEGVDEVHEAVGMGETIDGSVVMIHGAAGWRACRGVYVEEVYGKFALKAGAASYKPSGRKPGSSEIPREVQGHLLHGGRLPNFRESPIAEVPAEFYEKMG